MESSANSQTLAVAIPRPLNHLFTYRLPAELVPLAQIGRWAKVPFGRSITHAFIVELPRPAEELNQKGLSLSTLKEVIEIADGEPVFSAEILALCRWVQNYYYSSLGDVLSCAVPHSTLKKRKISPRPAKARALQPLPVHDLNIEQVAAVETLEILRRTTGAGTALLHGITGSGKTEVYMEMARRTLRDNKGVIILVPEIALTSHLHRQFEDRLGFRVGLWHSALADGQRVAQMDGLRRGEIRVLVGARSAIFAPVQNLGLIVVDEEHDPGYKQEDRVRYHARDLAVVRGKMSGSLVILGSATPSLETRERVREGRYRAAHLTQRVTGGTLPTIEVIDMKLEDRRIDIQSNLSRPAIAALEATVAAGEQAIVYLNRRGFATFLLCVDCGEVRGCPDCSVSLTLYKRKSQLCCHMCGHHEAIPVTCKKCAGYQLKAMGAGTESLEEDLQRLIPTAKIARLDRDQITSVKRLEQVLDQFRNGESNILLGTQMLVKGHDFPDVTLVLVVSADALFRWPDFRASERAYQILQQVAGRTGRGHKPGKVLIQSYDTDHAVIQVLQDQSQEEVFLDSEREMRQALNYPPFGRLAKIRVENRDRNAAVKLATEIAQVLYLRTQASLNKMAPTANLAGLEILGPSEAFLERVKGIYRWDLLLKAKDIRILQGALRVAQELGAQHKRPIITDIDPYGI